MISMKHILMLPVFCLGMLFFTGCADSSSDMGLAETTGPFDEFGNYREDWAHDPGKWTRPSKSKPTTQIAKNDLPPPSAMPIVKSSPPVRPTPASTARVQSTPKPKPTVAAKPKPKPAATRYTVKKGDSLYAIALRNRSSVAAIQRANNISGSLIRPGQVLVIPKR
jgi:LysM repeat protein